jgi:hypothetical protein
MHSKCRLRRPAVWILLLVGLLLAVVAGAYLTLKHSGSDREEGFLAHGQVSAAIFGVDVDTPQSRRCLAKSDQAATTVRQGIPLTIELEYANVARAPAGERMTTGSKHCSGGCSNYGAGSASARGPEHPAPNRFLRRCF